MASHYYVPVQSGAPRTHGIATTHATTTTRASVAPPIPRFGRLWAWNAAAAGAHLAQAIAMTALINNGDNNPGVPVTVTFLTGKPRTSATVTSQVGLAYPNVVTAMFLWTCFAAHALIVGPLWTMYAANVAARRNPFRWIEYSFSSSLMIVDIFLSTGLRDVAQLIGGFAANFMMILFGEAAERAAAALAAQNNGGTPFKPAPRRWWLATDSGAYFLFGCAGLAPWVAILWYFFGAVQTLPAGTSVAAPLYVVIIGVFVTYFGFALAMILQQTRWAGCVASDANAYLYGEYLYVILSLTSKSMLAWGQYSAFSA